MRRQKERRYCFKQFGKSRKITLTLQDIQNVIHGCAMEESAYHSDGTWATICTSLQVPNSLSNRIRLRNIFFAHLKPPEGSAEERDVLEAKSPSPKCSPLGSPDAAPDNDIEYEDKDLKEIKSSSSKCSPLGSPDAAPDTDIEYEDKDLEEVKSSSSKLTERQDSTQASETSSENSDCPVCVEVTLRDESNLKAWVTFRERRSVTSGDNVEKHFQNLQNRLQTIGFSESSDRAENAENDFEINLGHTTFHTHFAEIVANAPVDVKGEPNEYHSPTFMPNLVKYFLPQAVLWSGLMLGDLGRHGKGPAYNHFSKIFMRCSQSGTQNYTEDNKTQAIMEKSQWDLKKLDSRDVYT
ncbi:uncharacterized protein LOC120555285 [Perca fluviatilis]|uniref:uncharacterized protein LOC120555285 n=1 Tax=Perca fluviatilis TaxID=8168 RepID=UPI00196330A9|nr:uncharacterized protein LOC120555285 [Perca fluviatilis]